MTALDDFYARRAKLGSDVETPLERALAEQLEVALLVRTDVEHTLMKNTTVTSVGDVVLDAEGREIALAVDAAEIYEVVTTREVAFPELPSAFVSESKGEFWLRITAGHLTKMASAS